MSCFIVNMLCIDDAVTLINKYIEKYKDVDKTAFGKKLFDMNCDAYSQRYKENRFRHTYHYNISNRHELSMFYNLCALIYNCAEGSVRNDAVFKELENYKHFFIGMFYDKYIDSNREKLAINMKQTDLYHYMFDKIVAYMNNNNIQLSWGS